MITPWRLVVCQIILFKPFILQQPNLFLRAGESTGNIVGHSSLDLWEPLRAVPAGTAMVLGSLRLLELFESLASPGRPTKVHAMDP
jgi:hypothetical protein